MVLRVLLISWDWLAACVEDARALLNARARRARRRVEREREARLLAIAEPELGDEMALLLSPEWCRRYALGEMDDAGGETL